MIIVDVKKLNMYDKIIIVKYKKNLNLLDILRKT
jgi:hypothetical protein